jgi:two-component system alkaline phosphatase synthesis response regulator PhoP
MGITIDREKYIIVKEGKVFELPKKEFEILSLLSSVHEKVFSRRQIFNEVWGEKSVSNLRTVDVHIVSIRKKLGVTLIKTLKGVGYKVTENIKIK